MNHATYAAARAAGCTRAEAELLAWYVVTEGMRQAAEKIGVSENTARSQAARIRRRFNVPHLGAALRVIYTRNID